MLSKRFLLFFITTFLVLTLSSFKSYSSSLSNEFHPYHVGSVEFNYNSKTKTFEITGKFFLDDLENALKEKYGTAVHFNDEKYKAEINELLKSYCSDYLKLKTDNKFLKINYIGFEEDSEAVNIFLESEATNPPKKVETAVSFLYNLFDDQMNIIHIIVNGKRQSEKLNYPNRYLYKNF
ncbi:MULTISPECIES: DUF6702 family protein [unclassified Kaistella]|uniref:DUF6702 family protein n=1 Tax=unclassified Kaistella TaxID=2762626 RepID=UPI00273660CA|nr:MULTISPECIES: DUF6702 family protein [unclassified Kaistella]MDP2454450.1 hypothetical protein [Kaistella sp. SH11-4b]MDP2457937.1 hypothetical protein [Kaistella sp. SH40-3]MDP2460843.1 hypothetical protein [Kaistella sp. SH19-2b]